jgi:ABC-2 type transport system ATP-binding protein
MDRMGKRHAHPSKASRRRSRNESDSQNNHHNRMTFPSSPAKIAARMSTPDTREIILEARELTREFEGVKALDRFSFKLHRGEVLGLLGANGAGKTTAMNCLLGLTLPTSGDLFAFGLPLQANRIQILQRSNFSSAYTALPGNLLVWQNLLVFARIYGVPNPKKKIAELMELLEISHLDKRVTGQLSAGESTRVNLCKAFLNDPELLMLDEPTASLDPDIADKVRKVVRKVQRERDIGILYTSHNMRDIEEVCDRVIFLHKGKIVCEGTPSDIVAQSSSDNLEDVFIKIARDGEILDEPKKDPAP